MKSLAYTAIAIAIVMGFAIFAPLASADHAVCTFIGEQYDTEKKVQMCVYDCKGREDKVLARKTAKDCPGSRITGGGDHEH